MGVNLTFGWLWVLAGLLGGLLLGLFFHQEDWFGGYASFRVLVGGSGTYRLSASVSGGLEVDLYRAWYHHMKTPEGSPPAYWPDALVPVESAKASGRLPDPDNAVPGQTVQEFWVDVYGPREARPGTAAGSVTLKSGRKSLGLDVSVEVLEQVLPEEPCITAYHKCYGSRWLRDQYPRAFARCRDEAGAWLATIELLHHYYRLNHEHRALFRSRGGGHAGNFDPIYSPRPVGTGRGKHLEDWELFDRYNGPQFDGSVLSRAAPGAPRPRRPAKSAWGAYAPISPDWPASYLWWGQPGYQEEFVNCVRQFDGHLRERGWTATQMEMFFFHKKRYRWFEWDGDEAKYAKDDAFFLEMWRLLRRAVDGSPVRWVLRVDASWQQKFQFERLAGAATFWVLGGFWRWYREEIRRVVERGDIVWWYGGTPSVDMASAGVLENVFKTWVCGLQGYNHWLATDPGPDPWFACEGASTGMLYPGERFGIAGPLSSTRLKIQRNGLQDLDLVDRAARRAGRLEAVREELSRRAPVQLWTEPPRAAQELPPEDWDSVNLSAEHEPVADQVRTRDPAWWRPVREAALAGG